MHRASERRDKDRPQLALAVAAMAAVVAVVAVAAAVAAVVAVAAVANLPDPSAGRARKAHLPARRTWTIGGAVRWVSGAWAAEEEQEVGPLTHPTSSAACSPSKPGSIRATLKPLGAAGEQR